MTGPEPRRPEDELAAQRRLTMDYPVEIEFPDGPPAEEGSPTPPEPVP